MGSSNVVWSDHQTFLLNGLRQLFIRGEGSDFHIKCGNREFAVHKMVLNLFTDYFQDTDGLWLRIEMDPRILEKILTFLYHGQVHIQNDQMEPFLRGCRCLQIRLFHAPDPPEIPKEPAEPRYELSDFQLLCRVCYKVLPDDRAMKRHQWGCTRQANFACRFCHRTFKHKFVCVTHERVHTGEKPFPCSVCGISFSIKTALTNHFEAKHTDLKFPCGQCETVANSRTALKSHVRLKHAKERPISCNQCGACFSLKCDLTAHVKRKHTNHLKTKNVPERDPETILEPSERQYHGKKLKQSKGFWKMFIGPLRVRCFFCDHVMLRQSLGRHFKQVHPGENVTKPMLTELDRRLKPMALERRRAAAQNARGSQDQMETPLTDKEDDDSELLQSGESFTQVDDIVSQINRLF